MSSKRQFSVGEARSVGTQLGIDWTKIDQEQFRRGLEVELEHGARDPETNVTGDDPLLTGKIAWAHLKEICDYYTRLDRLESEAEAKEANNMAINIRPLGDRIIVEPVEKEETIAGGMLVLPETAKEKPQQGKVLAVGAGRRDDEGKRIDMDVEVGMTVLFAKYSGSEIKLNGKKLLIMKESDVLGILE